MLVDPLATLDEDYRHAIVRLAWDVNRRNRTRVLLAGAVELVPLEIPPPLERPERSFALSHDHFVYASDRVLPARSALQWFQRAAEGRVTRPNSDGRFDPLASDAPTFAPCLFEEEPPAPGLVSASVRAPFVADWQHPARVRHLIPQQFSPEMIWSRGETERATEWLEQDTHFDWAAFPEFWGAIHLIAPNPVFRHLHGRLDRSGASPTFVNTFELRAGKSANSLEFVLESRHPMGIEYVIRQRPTGPTNRIQLPREPRELFERVYDDQRGLLYELGPFTFLSGVNTTVDLSTEVRRVAVAHHDGTDASYSVNLTGALSTRIETGDVRQRGEATTRLYAARTARSARSRGRNNQRWFRNQAVDAVAELRKLIGGTRGPIFVVDPYFTGEDLLRVLLVVRDPEIRIDVLLGAEHLRRPSRIPKDEQADHLERTLSEAAAGGRLNPIEIRVMTGATPAIHDRFLGLKDDLWMLGSSLQAFGSRGTLMVKVPDPEPVVRDLCTVWNESTAFPVWLAKRRSEHGE